MKVGGKKGKRRMWQEVGRERCCMGNAKYKCLVVVFPLFSGLQDH